MERASSLRQAGQARRVALLVHRYVGLVMTVFLVVAGLTGSFLVFYHELDTALNPALLRSVPPRPGAPLLGPFELQERVQSQLPAGRTYGTVQFDVEPGESVSAWVEQGDDEWREMFVNPYTGALLGSRHWGDLGDGVRKNFMPFVYRLHYSLALDELGTWLFGIVALLWTVDCFVGAYLTFPVRQPRAARARRFWLSRWSRAWRLRTGKLFSLVFTWHRASGLWIWAMLLVFAWSAVGLNLNGVYRPVMKALTGFEAPTHDRLPELKRPFPAPRLSLREAHAIGQRRMSEEAARRGFSIVRELRLDHHADHNAFSYAVESSLDLSRRSANTEVYFDGNDGHVLGFDAPTGKSAGNTLTSWIYALHFASVFGLWYRIVVSALGLLVVALSVTGVVMWLRKRRVSAPARESPRQGKPVIVSS